jgi:outer membrane protein assembly factor BamD (BamD/ComL family)
VPATAIEAEQLLEAGRWFAAFEAIQAGLEEHPEDPGLQELRSMVLDVEPRLSALRSALRSKDYRTAASIGEEIEAEHPSQEEIGALVERCLFNAALLEMRAYNLAGASSFLRRLEERNPEDEEVQRILKFIASYRQRSVDMQLKIFVGSLQLR